MKTIQKSFFLFNIHTIIMLLIQSMNTDNYKMVNMNQSRNAPLYLILHQFMFFTIEKSSRIKHFIVLVLFVLILV